MKRWTPWFLLSSVVFPGCLAAAVIQPGNYAPPPTDDVYGKWPYGSDSASDFHNPYLRHTVTAGEELTIERLLEIIQTKKLTKVEDVIAALPWQMKEDNYVLVYRSRSLQESTPQAPRAILYSPTASFALTFGSGDPALAGADTIETVQFRKDTNRFEFREIRFANGRAEVGLVNPGKCLACHQSATRTNVDPRPNWEPYSTWLGVYGSDDGGFHPYPIREHMDGTRLPEDESLIAEQAHEPQSFDDFVRNVAPTHPRYSQLGHFNVHGPVDLTQHFAIWNSRRVARLMADEVRKGPLTPELVATWSTCPISSIHERIGAGYRWLFQFSYPQYRPRVIEYGFDSVSTMVAYLFEPFGADTSDWSMDFANGGRLAFVERFGTPGDPRAIFRWAWQQAPPGASELLKQGCDNLASQGFTALDAAAEHGELDRVREARRRTTPTPASLTARCALCHAKADGQRIPRIPFDDEAALAARLGEAGRRGLSIREEIHRRTSDVALNREQMPPGKRLSAEEREVLLQYIDGLAR